MSEHRSLRLNSTNTTIELFLEQLYTKLFFIDVMIDIDIADLKAILERKFELLESLRNSKKHTSIYMLKLVWEDHLHCTINAQRKFINTRV